jgi:endonuclease/exonuclease/phosphatase family metal-dependent hydrolase
VWDESGATRLAEAKQLHAAAMANGNPNTIIVGDFNAIHRPDYTDDAHWDWIEKQHLYRGIEHPVDTATMAYLIDGCGWRDVVRECSGNQVSARVSLGTKTPNASLGQYVVC